MMHEKYAIFERPNERIMDLAVAEVRCTFALESLPWTGSGRNSSSKHLETTVTLKLALSVRLSCYER